MIGVVAHRQDHAVIREFFELFKTPWEFCRPGVDYDAVLDCGGDSVEAGTAKLIVIYSGRKLRWDEQNAVEIAPLGKHGWAALNDFSLPIYGDGAVFGKAGLSMFTLCDGGRAVRIGYNLADEIRFLLTEGQPAENAAVPTLELHIALLRRIILDAGMSVIEVPPTPAGYKFISCLTHDVDHPSIRHHRFDRTVMGFLFRAVIGSALGALRSRIPAAQLFANWWAALKLPFVQLGLAKDFWSELERYIGLEQGSRSTFFVIPFRKHPGVTRNGAAPTKRGAAYGARDIAPRLQMLAREGCEIGLHGLDAWADSTSGRREAAELKTAIADTGNRAIGVRMHWLYFDQESPATLAQAGFAYDSTVGYNETIGFRAGTTQVYKHLGTESLLELPLHVMDTALFYPSYLHLTATEAGQLITRTVDQVVQLGGCVTFNWHDRSIAPERIWGQTYADAIHECRIRGAWISSASEVVEWFRCRRAISLEGFRSDQAALTPLLSLRASDLPDLQLQLHRSVRTQQLERVGESTVTA